MDNILLYSKLSALPDNLKSEVSDFIDFLTAKAKKKENNHRMKCIQKKLLCPKKNTIFIL